MCLDKRYEIIYMKKASVKWMDTWMGRMKPQLLLRVPGCVKDTAFEPALSDPQLSHLLNGKGTMVTKGCCSPVFHRDPLLSLSSLSFCLTMGNTLSHVPPQPLSPWSKKRWALRPLLSLKHQWVFDAPEEHESHRMWATGILLSCGFRRYISAGSREPFLKGLSVLPGLIYKGNEKEMDSL